MCIGVYWCERYEEREDFPRRDFYSWHQMKDENYLQQKPSLHRRSVDFVVERYESGSHRLSQNSKPKDYTNITCLFGRKGKKIESFVFSFHLSMNKFLFDKDVVPSV